MDLVTIIIIVLVVMLILSVPRWGYSRGWGYGPSGIVFFVLFVLVILYLVGGLGGLNLR